MENFPKTYTEVSVLLKTASLLTRMEFGTAGLRSKMGAGFSQMNTLTIMQTVQGLLKYAQSQFSNEELREKVNL